MTLPSYANRTKYSAFIERAWSESIFGSYARAIGNRAPFRGFNNSATTTLYLYYTGDTDTVYFQKTGGAITVNINGVDYTPSGDSGTFTVSGLTANTVYAAQVSGVTTLEYLGFEYSISNTTAPTFSASSVLTAAQLSDLYDAITETETAANILPHPYSFGYLYNFKDTGVTYGGEETAFYGSLIGGVETIAYDWTVGADLEAGISVRVIVKVNGTTVLSTDYASGRSETPGSWEDNYSGTIDISSLGLTAGQIYSLEVRGGATGGSSQQVYFWVKVNDLQTYNTPGTPLAPATPMARGDTVSAANLQKLTDAVNVAHPHAGTIPLSYRLPALYSVNLTDSWKPDDYFYIRHRNPVLRYIPWGSGGEPKLIYNGGSVTLDTDASEQTYDLTRLTDMAEGEYYKVTNCAFAMEDTTDA